MPVSKFTGYIISTHTLTWSVTVGNETDENGEQNFNSHAHVERDEKLNIAYRTRGISTHTLTWSVTIG